MPSYTYDLTDFTAEFTHPVDGIPPWGKLSVHLTTTFLQGEGKSPLEQGVSELTLNAYDASGQLIPGKPTQYDIPSYTLHGATYALDKYEIQTGEATFTWKAVDELQPGSYTLEIVSDFKKVTLPFSVGENLSEPSPSIQTIPTVKYKNDKEFIQCRFYETAQICNDFNTWTEEVYPILKAQPSLDFSIDLALTPTATYYFTKKILVTIDDGAEAEWKKDQILPPDAKTACARLSVTNPISNQTYFSESSCTDLATLNLSPKKNCEEAKKLIDSCNGMNKLQDGSMKIYEDACLNTENPPSGNAGESSSGSAGESSAPPVSSAKADDSGCQISMVRSGGSSAGFLLALGLLLRRRRK